MSKIFNLTVSSKGQITLPAEVRRILSIESGKSNKLCLEIKNDQTAVIKVPMSLDELHEYLGPKIAGKTPLTNIRSVYADKFID